MPLQVEDDHLARLRARDELTVLRPLGREAAVREQPPRGRPPGVDHVDLVAHGTPAVRPRHRGQQQRPIGRPRQRPGGLAARVEVASNTAEAGAVGV